jgi:succinate dehydrogenase/fumarate reductase flavoprotein subunit
MDFRENPSPDFRLALCNEETRTYLERSGALQDTPIERLAHMNQPAIDLYRDHGIDLAAEPLEIAVCAQHTNGGLTGDLWWQSPLPGLYPVGEVNGSHGVYRPGGSALNSGQCGGVRAAEHIAARGRPPRGAEAFLAATETDRETLVTRLARFTARRGDGAALRREIQTRMTRAAGHIRRPETVREARAGAEELLARLTDEGGAGESLAQSWENWHLALAAVAYLAAVEEYLAAGGGSRGSALVLDPEGEPLEAALPESWRRRPEAPELRRSIGVVRLDADLRPVTERVPVRPVPEEEYWFETVWNRYRQGAIYG